MERSNKKGNEFIVDKQSELLEFLLLKFNNQARNKTKALLTHKQVLVNEKVVTKHNYLLEINDIVRISKTSVKSNPLDIIYEDKEIIVINKPSGLLSMASEKEKEITAYRLLNDYVKQNGGNRIFIVHRLDRDTSGLLMVAKSAEIKKLFQDNWSKLVSKRGYYAVVEGKPKKEKQKIRSWLKETKTYMVYSSYKEGDGKEAITNYDIKQTNGRFSILDLNLETGRKNQIRVHMQDIGHSIIGDKKYGAKTNPIKRLGLHAYALEVKHPITQKIMKFECDMPQEFSAFLGSKK